MFKKPVKVSAQNQLSGKDRKTMRNKLAQAFDQACVEKIMNVNDKIVSCKIGGLKMVIYNGNDYPLFVDGTGKNDYFPSLYTVIAYEPLLKVVDINQGVESYIYNGANLMWPGVRDYSGLGKFQKDQVVAIRTAKGQVIAVGALGCSLKDLQANNDNSGVAVYILHYYNDKLWESGPKMKPEVIVAAEKPKIKEQKKQQPPKQEVKVETKEPAKGKKQQQPEQKKDNKKKQKKQKKQKSQEEPEQKKDNKKEQKGKDKKKQKSPEKQTKQEKPKPQKQDKKKKKQSSEQKKKQQSDKKQSSDDEVDFGNLVHSKQSKPSNTQQQVKVEKKIQQHQKVFSDQEDDKKGKKKPAKKQTKKKGKKQSDQEQQNSEGEDKKEGGEQQKSVVSTKLMDQQFKQAFLNALKLSKVEGELPIDSGRFYMDFMLLARPPGVKLEIKDTSYKKLGKFYEEMSKQKFIEFKHNKDKKGQPGASIVKIFWDNEQLKYYEPTLLRMNEKDVEQKQEIGDSKKKLKLSQSLQVSTAYKLHPAFKNALYPKKVNYAPTEEEQKQMKREEEQVRNLPQYYSQNQVRALIEKYINDKLAPKKDKDKKQDKQKKVQKMVSINYKQNQYLAQLLKKQIEEYEQNAEGDKEVDSDQEEGKKGKKKRQNIMKMDRGALVNRILKTCSTSYHLRDKENNVQTFNQGTFKGIQLVAEKSNNKNITKIIGLETFIVPRSEADEQINGFANLLKQKFASSVNVQNLPGKNAGKEIIVHGNFINELEDLFTQEYKIHEDYITSQNKLDKKKKR